MEGELNKFNFLLLIKPFNTLYLKKNFTFLTDLKFSGSIKSYSTRTRDSSGKFISASLENKSIDDPLPSDLKDALIGDLLGDGHLRFTHLLIETNQEIQKEMHFMQ